MASYTEERPGSVNEDDMGQSFDDHQPLQPILIQPKPSWRNYILEPLLFTYFFSYALTTNANSNLYFDRACVLMLNHTVDECKGNDTDLFNQVQIIANNYNMVNTLIRFVPPAIMGVFIGPWSDKYGRKPPVFISLLTSVLSSGGMLWYVSIQDAPLYYSLITNVPVALSGGLISCVTCIYALASENTAVESRTMKYAVLEVSITVAVPLASLCAGFLFNAYGYVPVYLLSLICSLLPLLFFAFVKDDVRRQQASWTTKLKNFFSCDSIRENYQTAIKPRERNGRLQILLLTVSMMLIILNLFSVSEILFYFSQKMYKWSMLDYSQVITYGTLVSTFVVLIMIRVLTKVLKVSDTWICLIGLASMMAMQAVRAFAYESWLFYISIALGFASSAPPLSVRSILSKIVEKNELGKIFSVLAQMESLVPIIGALLSTQIYNATVGFFPGLVFLVLGVLMLFPLGVFIWLTKRFASDSVFEDNLLYDPVMPETNYKVIN